jgi:hypothetical protein
VSKRNGTKKRLHDLYYDKILRRLLPHTLPSLNPPPEPQTDEENYLHARSLTVAAAEPILSYDDDDDASDLEEWIARPWM